MDTAPVFIAHIDQDERIRSTNAFWPEQFRVPADRFLGAAVKEVVSAASYRQIEPHIRAVLRGENVRYERQALRDGDRVKLMVDFLPDWDADHHVRGFFVSVQDVTAQRRAEQARKQLVAMACFDSLTGLVNRGEFGRCLQAAGDRAARQGTISGLLFLDVDHFKAINDTHGHAAGDEVLQELAVRLKASVRRTDTVCRFAGDEFLILLEDIKGPDEAAIVARTILASMTQAIVHGDLALTVGVSLGIALRRDASMSDADFIAAADQALYDAKTSGRGTFRIAKLTKAPPPAPSQTTV